MTKITNQDLYGVLLEIKEDIGGLKSASGLHLEGLRNHGERISALETTAAKQKGAVKVWGLVATAAATCAGAALPFLGKLFKH